VRGRWRNFENKQSQKAIEGGPYNPKTVYSEVTLGLLLAGITMSLSACIVTYRDFPNATLESLPKNQELKPLLYHVEPILTQDAHTTAEVRESAKGLTRFRAYMSMFLMPGMYPYLPQVDPAGQPGFQEVGRTLKASGLFSDLLMTVTPPKTGAYCYIDFEVRGPSPWVTGYFGTQVVVGVLTAGLGMLVPAFSLLPYYTGEGGTTVSYTLYRDGQRMQTYRYPITKKGAGWIVLLPFAWLNFFTNDLKDAVRGTTLQFLIDAQRDGTL
jgi:hypothetical protein